MNNALQTVGIIGGLGAETTARFYLELFSLCQSKSQLQRPPIMIYSVPVSILSEIEEITKGVYSDEIPELLIEAAKKLEKSGVNFLVIPCNSCYTLAHYIQQEINIPILNIVDETIYYLVKNKIKKIGLISTLITRNKELYSKKLRSQGIDFLMPTINEQATLDKMVLHLSNNRYRKNDKEQFNIIINNFRKRGIEHVMLACGALKTIVPPCVEMQFHDTIQILAQATINEILR